MTFSHQALGSSSASLLSVALSLRSVEGRDSIEAASSTEPKTKLQPKPCRKVNANGVAFTNTILNRDGDATLAILPIAHPCSSHSLGTTMTCPNTSSSNGSNSEQVTCMGWSVTQAASLTAAIVPLSHGLALFLAPQTI